MSDEERRVFHLHRQYSIAPYDRWACDVAFSLEAPEGYEILDYDPQVADPAFFHTLSIHMRQPVIRQTSEEPEDGVIGEIVGRLGAGTDDHFRTAIRTIPGAGIRGTGREE